MWQVAASKGGSPFAVVVSSTFSQGVDVTQGTHESVEYDNQLVADHVRDLFQELDSRVPLGTPGDYPSVKGPKNTLDGSKAVRKLGLNCE